MRRAAAGLSPLLLLVGVAAPSAGQNPPASADVQKFEATRAFVRARNARDYAIVTPNGIDELLRKAETLEDERAIRELREVGPPPYPDGRGYGVQRKRSPATSLFRSS